MSKINGYDSIGNMKPQFKRRRIMRRVYIVVILILIPAILAAGVWLFKDRSYGLISAIIAFMACLPFFISFEKRQRMSRELTVIAVMTGISVMGRLIFAPIPGFKPVAAITIIAAASLGAEPGFIIGAMSAVISGLVFGPGPWTPFQMLSWGMIGFLSGLAGGNILKKRWLMCVIGIAGGVLFSMVMDVWTVLSYDGNFNIRIYTAALYSALPVSAVYSLSNIIFLLLLARPLTQKLERVKTKYGVFVDAKSLPESRS